MKGWRAKGQFHTQCGVLETALGTAFAKAVNTGTSSTPVYDYWVMAINPASAAATCTASCAFDEVCDGEEAAPTCEKKVALVNLTSVPGSIIPSGRSANLQMSFAAAVANPFGTPATVKTLTVNYLNVSKVNTMKLDTLNLSVPVFLKSGIFAKTNWNYWLVSSVTANAAANVIHNPSFVFDVLSNTTTQVLNGSTTTW